MKYFKIGRKYDEYRLIGVEQRTFHVEIILQAHEEYFSEKRFKSAIATATRIAKSFGIVTLTKVSEPHYTKTGKKLIVFDENNNVSEEEEILVYYIFYFNRKHRPKRKKPRK